MVSFFWDVHEITLIDYLIKGISINGKYYTNSLQHLDKTYSLNLTISFQTKKYDAVVKGFVDNNVLMAIEFLMFPTINRVSKLLTVTGKNVSTYGKRRIIFFVFFVRS